MKKKVQRMIVIIATILIISGSLAVNVPDASAAETISFFNGKLKIPTNVGITQAYKGSAHKGIDYAGNPGERGNPIYAVYDGVVKNAGDSNEKGKGFGNWVVIEHKSPTGTAKLYSVYGHMELKDILVKIGQKVTKGQQIAKIGNAGKTSGPHLHFALSAVYPKLSYIDPTSYLEKTTIKNPVGTAYNATAKITTPSGLNVRKSASVLAERIGGVYQNNMVTIVAKAGDFYKIKFGTGYGYISNNSSYLTIQTSTGKETTYNATAQITTPSGLNVRKSASASAERIGGVYQNDIVTIVAKAGDFYKIKFGTGYGYITNNSSYLTIQASTGKETTYNKTAQITTPSGLNVRKSANASAERIGGVYQNDMVTIVAKAGDFYKIKFGTGYGYISNNSSYLTILSSVPSKPTPGGTVQYNVSVSYQSALNIQIRNNPQISKGGRWVNASRSEVDTYMNPQKILNDPIQKYQFLDISQYEGVSEAEIANYLKGKGVLAGKASIFMKAARDFKISPIYLVAHANLETDQGTSELAKGYVSKLGYTKGKKVYNVYGYGANDGPVKNGIDYAIENGAKSAYKSGWLTLDKAIYNGAQTISKYHFHGKYNQITLYENRWNPKSPGVNQYATDVRWAYNQAADFKKMYDKFPNAKLVFKVPVYK